MGRVGTIVVSDRGDLYLPQCLNALWELKIHVDHVVDDSDHMLGMSGAVNAAWSYAAAQGWDYLFHVEEDFIVNDAPLVEMCVVVAERNLAQMVLKRQPWWGLEVELGDQLAAIKQSATFRDLDHWTEHQNIFSLNPCVIPRRIFSEGWPVDNEAGMTERLLARGEWFGVLGQVDDEPRCVHIGAQRGAGWRL